MPRLRGVSVFDAGTKGGAFSPIRPGDSFSAQTENLGVRENHKTRYIRSFGFCRFYGFCGARILLREHRIDLFNQRGELVSSLTARSAHQVAVRRRTLKRVPGRRIQRRVPAIDMRRADARAIRKRNWTGFTQTWMRSCGAFRRGAEARYWGRTWRSANNCRNRLSVPMMSPMHRLWWQRSERQMHLPPNGRPSVSARGRGTDPETGARRIL